MANPRQRRKARSSSHSAVKQSRRAKKNLRKHPAIKGPKLLQDAWDKHKTVRQNYEALGLAHSLNPVARGGTEKTLLSSTTEPVQAPDAIPSSSSSKSIPRGFGKIIKDENGAVIGVELPEEVEEAGSGTSGSKKKGKKREVWGDAMDDSDEEAEKMIPSAASQWVGIGSKSDAPEPKSNPTGLGISQKKDENKLITDLEKLSASGVKVQRHASMHEIAWLRDLVAVHGRDISAMSHDLKRNVWQKTPGEIKRAISKAGGFDKLTAARTT